jgi:hypothetical protein
MDEKYIKIINKEVIRFLNILKDPFFKKFFDKNYNSFIGNIQKLDLSEKEWSIRKILINEYYRIDIFLSGDMKISIDTNCSSIFIKINGIKFFNLSITKVSILWTNPCINDNDTIKLYNTIYYAICKLSPFTVFLENKLNEFKKTWVENLTIEEDYSEVLLGLEYED